jgi:secondary thiamine-phosphate synthase enzyme
MMKQLQAEITVPTRGAGLVEITREARRFVASAGLTTGLLTVYCRHTSASLLIQENADPDVVRDLEAFFRRLVPDGDPLFIHTVEGPDDMPAHVKAALLGCSLTIPVSRGQMCLGTWQGIYLCEHRRRGGRRRLVLTLWGEGKESP